jgi:hypothetical protein
MRLALVLASLACVVLSGCSSAPTAFADKDVNPFVDAHNAVRAAASPVPSPALPKLSWDDKLEGIAQAWSAGCVFEHSHNGYGENIAYFSGNASTPKDVVDGWASEVKDYDYANNSCAANQQCGHYTQIVWRDTARVGCGASKCNMFGQDGIFWVCNYDPPGNVIGQRPY